MTAYILFIPLLILILNFLFNKKNVLQSLTEDKHQKFVEKKKYTFNRRDCNYFI